MAKKPKKLETPTDIAIREISKKYGEGALQVGRGTFVSVEAIPTGIASLDLALGCAGIPRGRIIEIYGNESGGKTTLCLQLIASCQKHGGTAAFIDAEHALDLDWAEANGVDLDKLLVSQPDSGNEALNIVETLIDHKAVDLIVTDSVAALVPQAELDGEVGDHHIGAQARMISQAMRKFAGKTKKSRVSLVFVNQLRDKIGVSFGSPEQTPGGRALKFYSSIRVEVRRKGSLIVKQNKVYGMESSAKVVKNKVAPPFLRAVFEIHFGQPFQEPHPRKGIDLALALLDASTSLGVLNVRGSFYYLGKDKLVNGREAMLARLIDDRELYGVVEKGVYDTMRGRITSGSSESKDRENNDPELDD